MEEFVKISIKWNILTSVPAFLPENQNDGKPRYGPRINWDVPHAIYRTTSPMDINNPPSPYQVLTEYDSIFVDDNFELEKDFYYYVSELRPGGEYFTNKHTKLFVKEVTFNIDFKSFRKVNFSTPSDAPSECSSGVFMESGSERNSSKPYYCTIFKSAPSFPITDSGYPLTSFGVDVAPVIHDEWFYTGEGIPRKYLLAYVDDVFKMAILRSPDVTRTLDTQSVDYDIRNYPPPKKDSGAYFSIRDRFNGVTGKLPNSGFPSYGINQLRPEWWDEYPSQVDNNNPATWHSFWRNRPGNDNRLNPRDNNTWYNDTW